MGTEKEGQWDQSVADAYSRLECLILEPTTEADLFSRLIRVYLEEEEVRIRQKLKRKSSQRISRVMHERVGEFLSGQLAGLSFQVIDGLLFMKKDEQLVGALKCIPDLGSYDTPSWNATLARFAKQYQKRFKLAPEKLLFVVCSLAKSLDAAHAKALTGIDVWCGAALTTPAYRDALQVYVNKYVEVMDALPQPVNQVYFLSADVHPNALACQLLRGEKASMPDRWLQPSVSDLIQLLQTKL
ncbi:hypothetical protein [Brevibacillus porteri]|uniref:Uncharacterized protein n=1 Tax=Brevibacillus porteri TaxID=2126350 RepID=A0ABX5FP27_9BACL|nr:hypothetical protein [Brevibacillus porteri]ATF10903.1 hypothetical protein A616_02295 [Brevibacillus brevis X23]MDC0764525.1 hypothetical protein [Brevibacillus sp. AG]MED2129774.1 hypothetical protein [Brevibacillus porteri]MED2893928.1 hypothetical protein [Brevibacillus porteri]MED4896691.1 hypothetical protein [Brevibacillus porteri]